MTAAKLLMPTLLVVGRLPIASPLDRVARASTNLQTSLTRLLLFYHPELDP